MMVLIRFLGLGLWVVLLVACGGDDDDNESGAATGGNINPSSTSVLEGETAEFTVTADSGFDIDNVTGCSGTLVGNTFTTGAVTADCTISASFVIEDISAPDTFSVTATAGAGGTISPASATVEDGDSTSFTVTADAGFVINSVSGCGEALDGNTYTTGAISDNCSVSATFSTDSPGDNGDIVLSVRPVSAQ